VTAPEGIENLKAVGIPESRIHFVGNPMIDTLLANLDRFDAARARSHYGLAGPYAAVTIHRPSNVDDPLAARRIVDMLVALSGVIDVVLPLHPRGQKSLETAGLRPDERLQIVEPLGYIDFLSLVRGSTMVVTDSGGVQEETTMLRVPCLTVRRNTERPITITHGSNRLVEPEDVEASARAIIRGEWRTPAQPPPLWDGRAGERIADVVSTWLDGQ